MNAHIQACREIRTAILLVDFQQRSRHQFTYEHGPLDDGIARTVSVVRCARAQDAPIVILTAHQDPFVFPEINSAAGPGSSRIGKRSMSAFEGTFLETMLNAMDVGNVVVGGWVRHQCVIATIRDSLAAGFSVMTSDEILFGNREMMNSSSRTAVLAEIGRSCQLYDTAEELLRAISASEACRAQK